MTTTPQISVRTATGTDREVLHQLWTMFRHDMSAVDGALPDPRGRFRDERLRAALRETGWLALLATAGEHPAGFALVRGTDTPVRVMNSFFVVNAVRRRGVGRALAASVLRSAPGRWEIPFQEANRPAAAFWRRVAAETATGAWTVELRPGRPGLPPDAWLTLTT